ncbi:MAG: hypothetical protein KDA96_21485 [Planctomycetaceae bacterium]|nr:hypothetical protein [Planctomycetaceae bacterium]
MASKQDAAMMAGNWVLYTSAGLIDELTGSRGMIRESNGGRKSIQLRRQLKWITNRGIEQPAPGSGSTNIDDVGVRLPEWIETAIETHDPVSLTKVRVPKLS